MNTTEDVNLVARAGKRTMYGDDSATESIALLMATGEAMEAAEAIPNLALHLARLPAFQCLITKLPDIISTKHYAERDVCSDRDDEASSLRFLVAEVFLAGVLHGKLFDSRAILNPYAPR